MLQAKKLPKRKHRHVSAILVLNCLPRLHIGATLAHELMHAWLHMAATYSRLPLQVEEGLCELLAYLWIEHQNTAVRFLLACVAR